MNTDLNMRAPGAWVLCEDERLWRFFEIELLHLGVEVDVNPSADRAPCLVVADTDAHPVGDLLSIMRPFDCPLLAFGYRPAEIPEERGFYLRRPFPLATLEAALRRLSATWMTTAPPLAHRQTVRDLQTPSRPYAAVRLDDASTTVRVGDFSVSLSPAEWVILRRLCDDRGEAVSREELATLLGGGGNSVEVYICHLRRKLEKPLGRRLISTVRGKGYRFD